MSEKKRILLIDDMQGIRDSLEVMLEIAGYEVQTAANGEAGLEQLGSFKPDLVITDIMMPKLDGTEVVMKLESQPTKVLAISAGAHGVSADEALSIAKVRADAVLAKPFSRDELLEQIRTLLPH